MVNRVNLNIGFPVYYRACEIVYRKNLSNSYAGGPLWGSEPPPNVCTHVATKKEEAMEIIVCKYI